MLWMIGGGLALLLAIAWAVSLSVAVGRGEKWVVSPDVLGGWVFHAGVGTLALWLFMRAVA